MSATIVIGGQWGDEGKGKLVDFLSQHVDYVVRYQGGANAGHTVYLKEKKYVFHLIPGGILRPGVISIIGNGVVFDPPAFFQETELLQQNGIEIKNRLYISDRVHVIFPYHKLLDQLREQELHSKKLGTTGRGIGPAYVDKYDRCGIRLVDLYDPGLLSEKLHENLELKNKILVDMYRQSPLNFQEIFDTMCRFADQLRNFVADTSLMLFAAWKQGRNILLEGAQGSLLDVDFGSYPYVTSSHPTAGGAICGSGLPVTAVRDVIGVLKAYATRVGNGPFPSEDTGEQGTYLRDIGCEYGATTGRSRRCGWFDAIAAQFASRINGFTGIALTKLDVLDRLDKIKICVAYQHQGQTLTQFPANTKVLSECKPVYEQLEGWRKPVSTCRRFEDLPVAAQNYIRYLEKLCAVPISHISVGVERDAMIIR
jgi:adenylosuccinate synthase